MAEEEDKIVHLNGGANHFAPCGVRTSVHAADFDFEKGMVYNKNRDAEMEEMKSSTDDLWRITCKACQKRVAELAKKYNSARRKKEVTW
jgi:hypothetical protein